MEAVNEQVRLMEIEKELAGPQKEAALAKYDAVLSVLAKRIDAAMKAGLPPDEFPKGDVQQQTEKGKRMTIDPLAPVTNEIASPEVKDMNAHFTRTTDIEGGNFIHTDSVYNALFNAASAMERRLKESLENYQKHPDVQANLQQLQYDLQQWNLALTTMTNINKNMGDALNSIASNFR